jgi:hypothetical protein
MIFYPDEKNIFGVFITDILDNEWGNLPNSIIEMVTEVDIETLI